MRLLDLFCGAGGAGMGYHRAGFEVTGVDINPQRRFPFTFHQGDALAFLAEHGHEYDVIHASPPCQRYSVMTRSRGTQDGHPDLVDQTRDLLEQTGRPYVIENVPGSPLRNPIVLCGVMFGLKVYRHRLFESNILLLQPPHTRHPEKMPRAGRGKSPSGYISVCGSTGDVAYAREAMGINWMAQRELSQAIPPAYTEFIGKQLRSALAGRRPEMSLIGASQ